MTYLRTGRPPQKSYKKRTRQKTYWAGCQEMHCNTKGAAGISDKYLLVSACGEKKCTSPNEHSIMLQGSFPSA